MISAALRDRVVEALWPGGTTTPGTSVWAVLDAARDERIYIALMFSRLEYLCLYSGDLPEVLKRAAPSLVELSPTYTFTAPLNERSWGSGWGIVLRTSDATNLRHHLRSFLRVQDEQGRKLIFRYYDPRVLRVYLPTCNKHELETVYGPVDSYLMEDEHGENLIEYRFD